jgi:hypothetical protein
MARSRAVAGCHTANAMPTGTVSKVTTRMRKLERALLAGGLGFAVSCIAGCGGGAGLLSGDQANTLNNRLSQISGALQAGHCGAVPGAAQQLISEVASLPSTLNGSLRQNLDNGANTVSQLAVAQCRPAGSQTTTTPTTTSTPTTTPTSTSTTTTPTTTPATGTTTTTTPATTPPPPGTTTGPSGGSGLGGGASGSGSGGGSASGSAPGQSGAGAGNGNGNGNNNG